MTQKLPPVLDDFTVVIPTLGRSLLQGCLESIAGGSAWPAMLTVVDQGSHSAVAGWLAAAGLRGLRTEHVRSAQTGTAAATNVGLERVRTRFVAVTHDDCRVAYDWLERMAARARAHPDSIITGMVQPEGDAHVPSSITSPVAATYRRPLLERDPLFPANMGFATAIAKRVGPFSEDPRLQFAEDAEWSYRALRSGVPIAYAPEVAVRHADWRDATQRALTYRRYARSQGGFYGVYLRHGDWFIARRAVFDLLRGGWVWLRGTIAGDRELSVMGRAYVSDLVPGIMAGCARDRLRSTARP